MRNVDDPEAGGEEGCRGGVKQPRTGKELFQATLPFTVEDRAKSWWYLASTLSILIVLLALTVIVSWWPLRTVISLIAGLVMVRGFILFHDFLHGAILKDSWVAKAILYTYGMLLFSPPASWRKSHNYHHAHVGKMEGSHIGSYPICTKEDWESMSWADRVYYRVSRHPVILICACVTVFLIGICLYPLVEDLRKHWDSLVTVLLHVAIVWALWAFAGGEVLFFSYALPIWWASAFGAYLFYVQHNFEEMNILSDEEWSHSRASLESSSYLKLGPIMSWFTGNIGYHHVHHLNSRIPFYRLPEAMAAIPELQDPPTVTLHPREIIACLRLKHWDPRQARMV